MANDEDEIIEDVLSDVGAELRGRPSVKGDVMRQVMEAASGARGEDRRVGAAARVTRRRWTIGSAAGLAAAGLIVALIWHGQSGSRANEAFAAAVQQIQRARTFSARQISGEIEDGKEVVRATRVMSKEPHFERTERGEGYEIGETMITDYGSRRRLILYPNDKTGVVQDISHMYSVDEATGKPKLSQLEMWAWKDVMKIAATAVEELEGEKVNGRDVRVLQSVGKEPVRTVWIDRETGKPVRVRVARPGSGSSFTYDEIRIDEPLDDALFAIAAPPGYTLKEEGAPQATVDEHFGKTMSKLMQLGRLCYEYAGRNGGFPKDLKDLVGMKGVTEQTLAAMVAGVEDEGRPGIVYRPPAGGKYPKPDEVLFYEAPHARRFGKVAVGFGDGHAEIMTDEQFEKLAK